MTLQPLDATPVTFPRPLLSVADLERLARFGHTARATILAAAEQLARAFAPMVERMREAANRPHVVSGLEGRYAVRAGLDPAYANPAALDQLVMLIMNGDAEHRGDRQLRLLTSESRSLIAAAAIRGWCYSYGDGPAIIAWHRLMGTTVLTVGCSRG